MSKLIASVLPVLGFAFVAQAQTPENFPLTASFAVYKCVQSGNSQNCDVSPGTIVNQKITIALSSCSSSNGETVCSGNWTPTLTVDGLNFTGNISISKATVNNASTYSAVAYAYGQGTTTVAPTIVEFAKNTVTDTAIAMGTSVGSTSNNTISYLPAVALGAVPMSLAALTQTATMMVTK